MHKYLPNFFIFLDQYNNQIFKNKNTNIGIIYRNYNERKRENELIKIAKACKKNRYQLFVSNDTKLALKVKADGIYVPSFNKSKKFISKSIYSITEFSKKKLHKYNIISCPGCYPTSIQIPLIPLIKKKIIYTENIIIDSKSGYSGAGKNINKKFKFKNLLNSVSAYGVGSHRHMAEMDQELSKLSKEKIKIFFTPHLIPMFRGILSTIYIQTKKNYTAKSIYNLLKEYHKDNYFIKIDWN